MSQDNGVDTKLMTLNDDSESLQDKTANDILRAFNQSNIESLNPNDSCNHILSMQAK